MKMFWPGSIAKSKTRPFLSSYNHNFKPPFIQDLVSCNVLQDLAFFFFFFFYQTPAHPNIIYFCKLRRTSCIKRQCILFQFVLLLSIQFFFKISTSTSKSASFFLTYLCRDSIAV